MHLVDQIVVIEIKHFRVIDGKFISEKQMAAPNSTKMGRNMTMFKDGKIL